MQIRIDGPGVYDRHENELGFVAVVDGKPISIKLILGALLVIREALGLATSDPIIVYATSGNLLKQVVLDVIKQAGESQQTYFISHADVLRVTGAEVGMPHVPKPWVRR